MDDLEKYLMERIEKDGEFKKVWEEEATRRVVARMIVEKGIHAGNHIDD